MKILKTGMAALGMFLAGTSLVHAGAWSAGTQSGAPNTNVVIPISFAGDTVTISSQATITVAAPLSIVSAAGANGQSCSLNSGSVGVVLFAFTPLPDPATVYCNVTIAIANGAAAGNYPVNIGGQLCAISGGGAAPSCTAINGQVQVSGGGGNTPPSIAYNPATGSTITYTGAGTASPIVATPSGGAGSGAAATTTVGACTITNGLAAFPTTNIAQLSFVGATVTPQNIVLPNCTPQAAQVDATLTCPQSLGGAAATNQVWTLRCPAAAVANTPPTITYVPAPGGSVNVNAGSATTISVGCPTDGAACNGSGSGLAATSRLESLVANYAGPQFSPLPVMVCAFVTEAGAATGGATLDFVAQAADPGDIRCTCPANSTGLPSEPFTVSVNERIPANSGAITATRNFTVVCGGPPTNCGSIVAANQAPGSIVALNNGGAAVQVTALSLVGASAGVSQTATCVVSGASAGSTFTVATAPTPLVLSTSPVLGGTVTATCTNSNTTTATATVTCSFASSNVQTCVNGAPVAFTLNCPGAGGPPPPGNPSIPVPAMSEQGRILLAALVLMLGLGVVGFRIRN